MMPSRSPVHFPSYLRGEADPDTLGELLDSGRRMRLFWPLPGAGEKPEPRPKRRPGFPGFKVSARTASLVREFSEYGD
jgi:hypothetical protein